MTYRESPEFSYAFKTEHIYVRYAHEQTWHGNGCGIGIYSRQESRHVRREKLR